MPPEKAKDTGLSPEISRLQSQLARDPKSKLFIPLAEEFMKAGMAEEAVMALEEGLKANPSYMSARVLLGKAYMEKGDMDGAMTQFETVIKAIPDNLLAHRKLADVYKRQGRYKDAIKSLRVVTILSPKDDEAKALLKELESGPPPPPPAPEPEKPSQTGPVSSPPYEEPAIAEAEEAGLAEALQEADAVEAEEEAVSAEEDDDIRQPVYDLSGADDVVYEEADAFEIRPALYSPPPVPEPSVVEMPVPEMETLEQVRQSEPASFIPEPAFAEEEIPDAGFEMAAEPVEEENPFSFGGDEVPAFAEEIPDAAFEMAAEPAEEEHLFSFGGGEEPAFAEEIPDAGFDMAAEPVDEAPFASAPPPATTGKQYGYAVKLDAQPGLDDIFAAYGGGGSEEVSTPAADGAYEIAEDLTSSETGVAIEPEGVAEEPAPWHAEEAQQAPEKEAFKTETLAELYISQGFYDRAINIYKDMLVESPGNRDLKQKLEDLYQLAGMTSVKAAGTAKEIPPPPMLEEIPATFGGFGEESPFVAEAASIDATPFETEAFEAAPSAADAQVDNAAIGRLEQFLENIRREGAR